MITSHLMMTSNEGGTHRPLPGWIIDDANGFSLPLHALIVYPSFLSILTKWNTLFRYELIMHSEHMQMGVGFLQYFFS